MYFIPAAPSENKSAKTLDASSKATSSPGVDRLNLSIRDVISASYASVRLSNRSKESPVFEAITVATYLADPLGCDKKFMSVQALGSGTLRELRKIIKEFVAAGKEGSSAAPITREQNNISLHQLILRSPCSTKLKNRAYDNNIFSKITVSDFLKHERIASARLMKVPNFGAATLQELKALIQTTSGERSATRTKTDLWVPNTAISQIAERALDATIGEIAVDGNLQPALIKTIQAHRYFADMTLRVALSDRNEFHECLQQIWSLGSRKINRIEELIQEFIRYAEDLVQGRSIEREWTAFETADLMAPEAALTKKVNDLKEPMRYIVRNRFGLDGESAKTLKVIGEHIQIGRQRASQINRNAIQRLRSGASLRAAWQLLDSDHANSVHSRMDKILKANGLKAATRFMQEHPVLHLAVSIVCDNLTSWASTKGIAPGNTLRDRQRETAETAPVDDSKWGQRKICF